MEDWANETARWIDDRLGESTEVEMEIGALVAAASDWTEDETELDDFVSGLVESGQVQLQIG